MKHCVTLVCRCCVMALAPGFLVLAGCGGGPDKLFPVRGVISFEDGQPARELAGGTVTFDSEELHKSATGKIQDDGSYQLTSVKKNDGAVLGRYKVMIAPPAADGQDDRDRAAPVRMKPLIDPRYQSLKTTDLVVEVQAKDNDIPLMLRRAR